MWLKICVLTFVVIFGTAPIKGQSFDGYDYAIIGLKKDTIFTGKIYCDKNEIKTMLEKQYKSMLDIKFQVRYRKNKDKKQSRKYATIK
jgi:hypothetical protein